MGRLNHGAQGGQSDRDTESTSGGEQDACTLAWREDGGGGLRNGVADHGIS